MPSQKPIVLRKKTEESATEKDDSTGIPKGIVASQIRRLSGDASSFPLRSSIPSTESFPSHEKGSKGSTRQNDNDDRQLDKRQMTNSYASSSYSSHQLTEKNSQSSSQSLHHMGQSLASASFQNSNLNPCSVDNVRVSTGSAGTPGALPKHGRTFTTTGPNRGQGVLTQPSSGRVPICGSCACQVRLVMGVDLVLILLCCAVHFHDFYN
jgi:hypothetical protein